MGGVLDATLSRASNARGFSAVVGAEFVETILARDSADPMELYRNFMAASPTCSVLVAAGWKGEVGGPSCRKASVGALSLSAPLLFSRAASVIQSASVLISK